MKYENKIISYNRAIIRLVLYLFLLSFIYGRPVLLSPQNQDTLNYVHIPFKWTQVSNVSSYDIQISNNVEFDDIIYESSHFFLLDLVTDIFAWGGQYYWRCRGSESDGIFSEWSDINSFSISSLPDGLFNLNTVIYEPDLVYNGITILDELWSGHIFAIDLEGRPVWYINSDQPFANGLEYKLGFTYMLDNGNILGYADGRDHSLPGRAFEMDINNQIVWQGPDDLEGIGVHHDVIRLPNGNTMAIASQDFLLPIPDADWPIDIDEIIWRGDRILEWDQDGNEVWSWSSFEHFSQDDWDYNQILMSFGLGFYDWTHSNAIWYDDQDAVVYLSVRYLNRITKIDYSTGDVIWSMGENTPSGDADVGNDLGFSYQHAVKVLDNRNLMIFDNGNDSFPLISRGLEISISDADSIVADKVWEYQLPDSVSSGKMSDCDRLPNGNSLLTSTHSRYLLEVSPDSQKVWEVAPYQEFSTYRGERVKGLHPQLFSVIQPDFIEDNEETIININGSEPSLIYTIMNHGNNDQIYVYVIEDVNGWFSYNGTINIQSNQYQELAFTGELNENISNNMITFSIYPEKAPHLLEIYSAHLVFDSIGYNLGDINIDNSIDIFDVIMIVDIILLNIEPEELQIYLADFNSDGDVNINDIIEVIEFILQI